MFVGFGMFHILQCLDGYLAPLVLIQPHLCIREREVKIHHRGLIDLHVILQHVHVSYVHVSYVHVSFLIVIVHVHRELARKATSMKTLHTIARKSTELELTPILSFSN